MQGRDRVTACFFGDGAVAEGEFHESLNLAALWKLPVLFLCENNLYAMGTALDRYQSETDLALQGGVRTGCPREAVDGMDVLAVDDAARRAVARDARRRAGRSSWSVARTASAPTRCSTPSCTATRTRSRRGGSATRSDVRRRRLRASRRARRRRGLAAIEAAVAAEVDDAVAFAEAGTWEPVERSATS